MFYIVKPDNRKKFKDLLKKRRLKIKKELQFDIQKISLPFFLSGETKDSVYILFCHETEGLCGSAHLLPSSDTSLSLDFLQDHSFKSPHLWECNRVFFHLPENSPFLEQEEDFNRLANTFYQGLYETLWNFSSAHHVHDMIIINPLSEHEDITFFGQWPWVYQTSLASEGYPEYALGILSFAS